MRYPEDLLTHLATNRNGNGRPSVGGYKGPAYSPVFPVDFDDADDLAAALEDTRSFVRRMSDRFDLPPAAIWVWFSGYKGFSTELPATLFGGFGPAPAPELAARLKSLAGTLAEGLPTLDTGIYERVRLWRVENTINGKSGRYKIPLAPNEVLTLDIDDILALAAKPRTVDRAPADEWEPNPDLVSRWEQATCRARPRRTPSPNDASRRRFLEHQVDRLVDLVGPHWKLGQKHDLALWLSGYLATEGFGEGQVLAVVERLAAVDEKPGDRANAVRDTYEKLRTGVRVAGYSGLRKLLPEFDADAIERLVDAAETEITIGGRRYRRPGEGAANDDPAAADADGGDPDDDGDDDGRDELASFRRQAKA